MPNYIDKINDAEKVIVSIATLGYTDSGRAEKVGYMNADEKWFSLVLEDVEREIKICREMIVNVVENEDEVMFEMKNGDKIYLTIV